MKRLFLRNSVAVLGSFIAFFLAVAVPTCTGGGASWHNWRIEMRYADLHLEGRGKYWAAIPSSSETQQIHSVVFSPKPHTTYSDPTHGNGIAYWRTTFRPNSTFKQSFEVSLLERIWNIDASSIGEYDLSDPEIALYLQATSILQADHPEVQQAAREIIGSETNPYRKALLILNFVYRSGIRCQERSNPDALAVLRTRSGCCEAYAFLFACLARAAGIPTRVVTGLSFLTPGEFPFLGGPHGESSWHLWNEIYLPGYGWVPVDATRGTIGRLGGDRIALSRGSSIALGKGGPTVSWFHVPIILLDNWKRRDYTQRAGDDFKIVVSCLEGDLPAQAGDRDGDGVPDDEDYCPDFPGRKETNGC